MLGYQMAFRLRADDGPLIALYPHNYKKRRRNASMRIDSLFVVAIRIDWNVSVYRSFSESYISLLRVGFKSLQCADVSLSSQNIAEMRLLIVIFR